jgi:hypothetical protein
MEPRSSGILIIRRAAAARAARCHDFQLAQQMQPIARAFSGNNIN